MMKTAARAGPMTVKMTGVTGAKIHSVVATENYNDFDDMAWVDARGFTRVECPKCKGRSIRVFGANITIGENGITADRIECRSCGHSET